MRLFTGLLLLAVSLSLSAQTKIDWNTQIKNFNGAAISVNATNTAGGYLDFPPISYNPYASGSACMDAWGNKVDQPLPANKQPAFGTNDVVLWSGLSPSMPFQSGTGTGLVQKVLITSPVTSNTGPCGVPLPVNTDYGLNTNAYFFGRGGLATDNPIYNSIQSLQGGVTANSYTAGVLYPAGTVVCDATSGTSCSSTHTLSAPAYLGGHTDVGHSAGVPQGNSIQTSSNPFSTGEGLVAGMLYYDDALHCLNVYGGSSWMCLAPGGVNESVQFRTSTGTFGGSTNFTWDDTAHILAVTGATTSGIQAPVFSASNTGSDPAFTDSVGNFQIKGDGTAAFQSIALTNGITAGGGTYGLSGSGVLTAASAGFTGGITVASGTYGLSNTGVVTAASYKAGGVAGFSGTCSTNPTVVGGIITAC